jgi:hypothetical protein
MIKITKEDRKVAAISSNIKKMIVKKVIKDIGATKDMKMNKNMVKTEAINMIGEIMVAISIKKDMMI